jgi:hypothetical protein
VLSRIKKEPGVHALEVARQNLGRAAAGAAGGPRRPISCWHCEGPHFKRECPKLQGAAKSGEGTRRSGKKDAKKLWQKRKRPGAVATMAEGEDSSDEEAGNE